MNPMTNSITNLYILLISTLFVFTSCISSHDSLITNSIMNNANFPPTPPHQTLQNHPPLCIYPPPLPPQTTLPTPPLPPQANLPTPPLPPQTTLPPPTRPPTPVSLPPPLPPQTTLPTPPLPPQANLPTPPLPPQTTLPPPTRPPTPVSLPPPSPSTKSDHAVWCVAKPTVPGSAMQQALDYACASGADCQPIQVNGACYQPDTVLAHASFAFNSYWQKNKMGGGTCDFGGSAMLVTVDPSYDQCHFLFA